MGGRGGGGGSPPQIQAPTLVAPREVPLPETFGRFLSQESQVPALSSFAANLNKEFRQQLETGLPGSVGATTQISRLVNQLLEGEIPADVQSQVRRSSAEQAQALGLPATGEMSRNLQARDFGFTSMDLMQQGAAYAPGLLEMANYLSPQQTQNYLFTTGQLRGEDLNRAQQIADVANQNATNKTAADNQNAMNKYNYDVAKAKSGGNSGLFGTLGGIAGAAIGSFVMPGAGTAIGGMLGSGLGSMAGGGGFSLGAGQSGGAMSSMAGIGSSLFGGGLMGSGGGSLGIPGYGSGGSGLGATAFSPIGQAFTMPQNSFGAPQYSRNMIYDYLSPSSPGGYGGGGSYPQRTF